MARSKANDKSSPPADKPTRRDEISRAEDQLRDDHALGILVRDRVKGGRLDSATLGRIHEETN